MDKLREKIYNLFQDIDTKPGRILDIIIVILIFIVSIIFVIKTYTIPRGLAVFLDNIENAIVGIFVIEYILRIWSAPNRLKQVFKFYSIIDFIAIMPIFFFAIESYQVLRIFRLLRLIRFLEGEHFFYARLNKTHVIIIRIMYIIFAIVFVCSGLIFYAEQNQPDSNMKDFADAVYFSIITLTTVGYGDITPVTSYGRFITILIVFSGIILIPWQVKELIKHLIVPHEKINLTCKTCNLAYHDADAMYCKRCGIKIE
ncbi:potassium channel family protein [Spirochaetota bacterium]